jgi:hypothetical protein
MLWLVPLQLLVEWHKALVPSCALASSVGFCAGRWEYTYAILSGSVLLISLFRSFLFFNIALKAGTRMHNAMAHRCPPAATHSCIVTCCTSAAAPAPLAAAKSVCRCEKRVESPHQRSSAELFMTIRCTAYPQGAARAAAVLPHQPHRPHRQPLPKDQGIVDEWLPQVLFDAMQSCFMVLGAHHPRPAVPAAACVQ